MRTAIVSDLHLGAASGEDVLRDAGLRRILLEEIADADRLLILGDAVELRDLPVGVALAIARPFFEELGAALAGREVIMLAGNHDYRFAEPLLDQISLAGSEAAADGAAPELGLEQLYDPSPGPTGAIAAWLGPARLRLAYPGIWLREDVYATHGHYADPHLSLPRAECIAAAALIRGRGPIPARGASPADYERVLRPIYGAGYAIAQTRRPRSRPRRLPSEAAWRVLSGNNGVPSGRQKLAAAAFRTGFPIGIGAVNRLLRAEFSPDISAAAITRSGIEGTTEMAARLGVDGGHVITGHTHRAGPDDGDGEWPLPGGGRLHNTGNWVFATAFHHPGLPPGPYWPGTVTWLDDAGPPRRVRLLTDHSHGEMTALIERATGRGDRG